MNVNVTDLERSLKFYKEALGFVKLGEIIPDSGDFIINYIGTEDQHFKLELTWLRNHEGAYELGENETHLAVRVEGDYEAIREYHRAMGVICYENKDMGLYFINDPDDYWIEILPMK